MLPQQTERNFDLLMGSGLRGRTVEIKNRREGGGRGEKGGNLGIQVEVLKEGMRIVVCGQTPLS